MPMVEDKNLDLDFQLSDNLETVEFDSKRIAQVISNLLSNAVRFTDKGSIAVMTGKEADGICVSVKDTGIGIQPEDMDKLYKSFSQIKTGNDRKMGSTGLGLAISKKIIDHHGGRIWAESEYGKGTAFSFILPFKCERRS